MSDSNAALLASFSQAVTESMNKALDKRIDMLEGNMSSKFDNIKLEIAQVKKEQAESFEATLKSGMDGIMDTIAKRQEAFEATSDKRSKAFENSIRYAMFINLVSNNILSEHQFGFL